MIIFLALGDVYGITFYQNELDTYIFVSDEYNNRLNAARDGESISRTRDLQGQSPFLINSNIEFLNEDTGFQYGLYYNVQGRTLEVVGTGIVPDVYTGSAGQGSLAFALVVARGPVCISKSLAILSAGTLKPTAFELPFKYLEKLPIVGKTIVKWERKCKSNFRFNSIEKSRKKINNFVN